MAVPRGRGVAVVAPCPDRVDRNIDRPLLSIVIPVLNEARVVRKLLTQLQPLRRERSELILVDGESSDETLQLSLDLVDKVISSPRGRALQMNAGAKVSDGEVLLFLHADNRLPDDIPLNQICDQLRRGGGWGFCSVRLSGKSLLLRCIERFMNWRSRLTGIGTGDQTFLITRDLFDRVGGFPPIPLMEDIAMSKSLKQVGGRPVHVGMTVLTSSRRWEEQGIFRTVFLMWKLRLLFYLGVSPSILHGKYYP